MYSKKGTTTTAMFLITNFPADINANFLIDLKESLYQLAGVGNEIVAVCWLKLLSGRAGVFGVNDIYGNIEQLNNYYHHHYKTPEMVVSKGKKLNLVDYESFRKMRVSRRTASIRNSVCPSRGRFSICGSLVDPETKFYCWKCYQNYCF